MSAFIETNRDRERFKNMRIKKMPVDRSTGKLLRRETAVSMPAPQRKAGNSS
jgi:hypothetical protein